MELSAYLFWDIDAAELDLEQHARWLMERVFSRGKLSDIRKVQAYYGNERILAEMLHARYLDPQTLNFLSVVYDQPKENFRCYKLRQSSQVHSPF